jgi:hypothetical protein
MSHGTLAARSSAALAAPATTADNARLKTILNVQWALAIACSYLVLFGRESGDPDGVGPIVVAAFLAVNLVVGRLRPATVQQPLFGLALAAADAVLVVGSLYVAGQLSVELVLLCLGILILAIAGLHTGPIALATLGLTAAYLGVVWFTGGTSLWRSSVLLRVPLLFTAAIVYAWLVELGSRNAELHGKVLDGTPKASPLLEELFAQDQAIERCAAALHAGAVAEAESALRDIAAHNRSLHHHARA